MEILEKYLDFNQTFTDESKFGIIYPKKIDLASNK